MARIDTFQARNVPQVDPDRAYASLSAFEAPGLAAARLGGAIEQVGATVDRLRDFRDAKYAIDNVADATTQWHDALEQGMQEAQKTGVYQGFAKNLRGQLDADLQRRIDAAPSDEAALRLKQHFAELKKQVGDRALFFEHGMAVKATGAKLTTALDDFSKRAYRDPTLAGDLYGQGREMIADAAGGGMLDPEQRQRLERGFGDTLWSAALDRRLETDPIATGRAIDAGEFDQYLDVPALARLKGRITRATGEYAARQAMAGGVSAGGAAPEPHPDAADAEADAALAPVKQRENAAGNPYLGYGGVDLSQAPLDETGFPVWPGRMGPQGISHAAGLYQIQPETWRPIAQKLGIHDFSADSQRRVARELYREQGLGPWAASAPEGDGGGLGAVYSRIDGMGLSPDAAAVAKEKARVDYSALEADRLRQQRMQQQAQQAVVRQAEDAVVADAYSPQPAITAQQIADDPRFAGDPSARLRMIQVVRNAAAGPGPTSASSHQEALALIDRIRRPDGDPQKITNDKPIYDALGGNQLSKTDFDFVKREFEETQKPEEQNFAKRKADFIKAVSPVIDKSNPLMGRIDRSGKQQIYAFEWTLDQKIEQYRKEGKNPLDLLDPSKPDYMGKPEALAPFQKTSQQSLQDRARGLAGVVPPASAVPSAPAGAVAAPVATAPIPPAVPPRKPGETPAEYLARIGLGGLPK